MLRDIKKRVEQTLDIEDISVESRDGDLVYARILYMDISKSTTKLSNRLIGEVIDRTASTVLNGLRKIEKYKKKYKSYESDKEKIMYLIDNIHKLFKRMRDDDIKKEMIFLHMENKRLLKELEKPSIDSEFEEIVKDLTPQQYEGLKERIKPYVLMCKDVNKKQQQLINREL